jgi:acylphosphatase
MEAHVAITVVGLVQGVGFRWFVHRYAEQFEVAGYVKNNFDGSVYIEAEGDRSLLEEFIKQVKVGPRSAQVKDMKIDWAPPTHMFKGFSIK